MGNIQKRPNRKWRARYRDEQGKEHSRHFDRKVDAQRWLGQIDASLVRGDYVDPRAGQITFGEYYEHWAERQLWAPTTRTAMLLAARSVTFADVPLRRLRPSHIEQWVKVMSSPSSNRPRPLAPGTVHTRFNNVHSALRAAKRDHLIASDPAEGVTLPRRRRAEAAMVPPTVEQVKALIEAADAPFRPFIALCAYAGLRLGEAAGLRVEDIDFLRKSLYVRRQVQRAGRGTVDVREPKFGSERTVHLPRALVEMLAHHLAQYPPLPQGWLFRGEGANPPHQNTIGHRWRKTLAAAGVPDVKLHDLRHFYASGLIAANCDVVTVQRALGHRSATVTLNTYSHLWPTAEDQTRQAAAGLMAGTADGSAAQTAN